MTTTRTTETATTTDGWHLTLYHYQPTNPTPHQPPVIICHGLAANKNSCDLGDPNTPTWNHYSLAAYLTQTTPAYDVWVPELRGNGTPTFDPHHHPTKYRWSVDDYIDKDVPAIIHTIQQWHHDHTGHPTPVFWIGKSMGGMIAYAYGETPDAQKTLKGVVTLGSPVTFQKESVFLEFLTRVTPRNLFVPLRLPELVLTNTDLLHHFTNLGVNTTNIDPAILQQYLRTGHQNVLSSKVMSHFSYFIRHADFCRYPKHPWAHDTFGRLPYLNKLIAPYSYTSHLHQFTAPLLAIAGGNDHLAPPSDVQYAVSHAGSKDATYLEFSKKNGYSADYGHLDLNLGLHAHDEIYPRIADWLREHSTI
jgi:alpha-beta hydrolase superfamily lysophospholipase